VEEGKVKGHELSLMSTAMASMSFGKPTAIKHVNLVHMRFHFVSAVVAAAN